MTFVLTEEEIKEALTQYLHDYKNNIFRDKDLNIKFHQDGVDLQHPLVADVTFKDESGTN